MAIPSFLEVGGLRLYSFCGAVVFDFGELKVRSLCLICVLLTFLLAASPAFVQEEASKNREDKPASSSPKDIAKQVWICELNLE